MVYILVVVAAVAATAIVVVSIIIVAIVHTLSALVTVGQGGREARRWLFISLSVE